MKKSIKLLMLITLISIICLSLVGCNLFTSTPKDTGTEEEKEEEEKEEEETVDYSAVIADILALINSEDYLGAISELLENIPVAALVGKMEPFIGAENALLIEDYYSKVVAIVPLLSDILPIIEDTIIPAMADLENANPLVRAGIIAGLTALGISQVDSDTYTYTKGGITYTIDISENNYVVTTATEIYTMDYTENYKAISCEVANNNEEKTVKYNIETNIISKTISAQYYAVESQKLVQVEADAATLEANISIQSGIAETPASIYESVPADFATKGIVYTVDETVLQDIMALVSV